MKKLAIITSHPIQYNAPLFKELAIRNNLAIKIFYTWSQAKKKVFDPGFGKQREWDIPLLEGYNYEFVENVSESPGSHHFKGIDNPILIKYIEQWGATEILVYGWSFKSHLECLRYFHKKIPVYFRGDSTLIDEKQGLNKILRTVFLKWVYRYVDKAFYVGTLNKLYFLKHGLKESHLIFAPHAIDNNRFFDKEGIYTTNALSWRRQLNIDDSDLVFLFAGKLEPKKNPELLIKAFLAIQRPGIHLMLVGNGILEKSLKEKYAKVSSLQFIDFQNQTMMPVVYRLGDVFVLPSSGPGETWGLAVNEAMACGKPVLVSDKCGCAVDLVENDKNGYVFTAQSKIDLTNKMQLCFENKNDLVKMGKLSMEKIKNWNFDAAASAIEMAVIN